jgi:hypothetical protein
VQLDEALAELEPLPVGAVAAAQSCYSWADFDAELAELLFDSADGEAALVRSDGERRLLVFGSAERAVQFEIVARGGGFDLVGFLTPGRADEVRAQHAGDVVVAAAGDEVEARADDGGAFTVATVAPGMVRLVIGAPADEASLITPWFMLGS